MEARQWRARLPASRSTWRRVSTDSSLERTGASTGSRRRTNSQAGTTMDPEFVDGVPRRRSTATSWDRAPTRPPWRSRPRGSVGRMATSRPSSSPAATLPRTRDTVEFHSGDLAQLVDGQSAAEVPQHLVRRRRRGLCRMPSPRARRRSPVFDPADPDWRRNPVLREARQRRRPPSGGSQSLQERHGGASLRGAAAGAGPGVRRA